MSIPTDLTTAKAAKMDAVGSTTRDLLGYGFEHASTRFSLDTDGSDVFAALAALLSEWAEVQALPVRAMRPSWWTRARLAWGVLTGG
jgi:hypothetical protein